MTGTLGRPAPLPDTMAPCQNAVGLGAVIMTTDGALPVEYLMPGDRIITHDQGAQTLARIEMRLAAPSAALVFRPSALGAGSLPPVVIAARQQLVLRGWRARAMFSKPAALIEARRLRDGEVFAPHDPRRPARLFQLHFEHGQRIVPLAGGLLLAASAPRR